MIQKKSIDAKVKLILCLTKFCNPTDITSTLPARKQGLVHISASIRLLLWKKCTKSLYHSNTEIQGQCISNGNLFLMN